MSTAPDEDTRELPAVQVRPPDDGPPGAPRCPSCGAGNDPSRELCWRCGRDLETGDELPRRDPVSLDTPPAAGPVHRHPRRWWLHLGTVLAAAAAVLAWLWWSEIGPFAPRVAVPDATFDDERYEGIAPQLLTLTDVAALTVAPSAEGRSFAPVHLVDDEPTTAWRADASQRPAALEETVDLFLAEPSWVSALVLRNGDQHDDATFEEVGRILRARIVIDGGDTIVMNLLDQRGPQLVELREPILTTSLRIEVLEVLAGSRTDDPALSDLELHGWPADPDDAALAAERATMQPAAGAVLLPLP